MIELKRTNITCRRVKCRGKNNRLVLAELNNGDRAVMCKKCGSYYTRPFFGIVADNPGIGCEPETFNHRYESINRKRTILKVMSS